jgi:hypothetical protein
MNEHINKEEDVDSANLELSSTDERHQLNNMSSSQLVAASVAS